jgi:hypothetical protein
MPTIMGGKSWGRTQLATARQSQRQFVWACVLPGRCLHGEHSHALAAHGKEKVYGSIP